MNKQMKIGFIFLGVAALAVVGMLIAQSAKPSENYVKRAIIIQESIDDNYTELWNEFMYMDINESADYAMTNILIDRNLELIKQMKKLRPTEEFKEVHEIYLEQALKPLEDSMKMIPKSPKEFIESENWELGYELLDQHDRAKEPFLELLKFFDY